MLYISIGHSQTLEESRSRNRGPPPPQKKPRPWMHVSICNKIKGSKPNISHQKNEALYRQGWDALRFQYTNKQSPKIITMVIIVTICSYIVVDFLKWTLENNPRANGAKPGREKRKHYRSLKFTNNRGRVAMIQGGPPHSWSQK